MKTKLNSSEQVALKTTTHWYTLIPSFITSIILSVVGVLLFPYGLILLLLSFAYFIYKVYERKNNLWVVTNIRVIDEFGVFSFNSKESPLDKINNISYHQTLLGRILGFGNVQIQTAAEIGSTTYYFVDNPKALKEAIAKSQEDYKQFQMKQQASQYASAILNNQKSDNPGISSELEKFHDLMLKGAISELEYAELKKKLLNF